MSINTSVFGSTVLLAMFCVCTCCLLSRVESASGIHTHDVICPLRKKLDSFGGGGTTKLCPGAVLIAGASNIWKIFYTILLIREVLISLHIRSVPFLFGEKTLSARRLVSCLLYTSDAADE